MLVIWLITQVMNQRTRSAYEKPSCKEFRRLDCARRRVSERNRRKAAALSAEMAAE